MLGRIADKWIPHDSWISRLQKFAREQGMHHVMQIADYRLIWLGMQIARYDMYNYLNNY